MLFVFWFGPVGPRHDAYRYQEGVKMRILVCVSLVGLYLVVGSIKARDQENKVPTTKAEIAALAGG